MSSNRNSEVTRSRFVRGIILDCLWSVDGAGSGFGFTFGQINAGFARSHVEVSSAEVRRELNDMVDDKLISRQWDGHLEADVYRISSRGREFKKAGMPWDKIDEFTGGQP